MLVGCEKTADQGICKGNWSIKVFTSKRVSDGGHSRMVDTTQNTVTSHIENILSCCYLRHSLLLAELEDTRRD